MLARTPIMQASSEFFAGKPAAAEQARPIECPDQDEGYFDMIMRHRPIRRRTTRILR